MVAPVTPTSVHHVVARERGVDQHGEHRHDVGRIARRVHWTCLPPPSPATGAQEANLPIDVAGVGVAEVVRPCC